MKLKRSLFVLPLAAIFITITIIWIFNTSKPGINIEGCLDGCSVPGKDPKDGLRIISINMLHGFPSFKSLSQRINLIADEIIRLDPDIVLMQEVPWTFKTKNAAKVLSEKTGMNYAYIRANGNRWAIGFEEGEAILSRFPIVEPGFIELTPQAGFFEHRVALHAQVRLPEMILKFYVTHLTNKDPVINQKQSEDLLDYVESQGLESILLAGDFNAAPDTPQIKAIGSQLIDTFLFGVPGDEGYSCCNDALNSQDITLRKRIDYIFITPDLMQEDDLVSRRVFNHPFEHEEGWLWASDHAGLLLDIKFGP